MKDRWNAEAAIKRRPNDYEHAGLSGDIAADRIKKLADAAKERGGPGWLVHHVKELAPCLFWRREVDQLADLGRRVAFLESRLMESLLAHAEGK